ncbi:hypothetical protein ACOSQ2_031821 [Xanthoceras sorbifolium]
MCPCSSATHGRHSKTPIASYCDGPSPSKNKFNIILHLILAKRPRKVCFSVTQHSGCYQLPGKCNKHISCVCNLSKSNFY